MTNEVILLKFEIHVGRIEEYNISLARFRTLPLSKYFMCERYSSVCASIKRHDHTRE